jgi:hypothetical protein
MDPKRRTIPTGGAADVPPDDGEAVQDESRDLFLHLTPDRVLESVEAAGLAVNPVCYPLNAYENRVYEVELADRSRVIAKFYRPTRWSAEQILEEHAFVAELAAEELVVAAPAAEAASETAAPAPYAKPELNKYTDMQQLLLADPLHEVEEAGWPRTKDQLG